MLKRDLVTEVERLTAGSEFLRESYEAAAAAILAIQSEDEGWSVINQMREHDGFAIHHLKEIYRKAKLQTKGNPLLKRGFTLRCSYVWGRGIEIVGNVPPRFQAKIDKNWDVLFTQSAFIANERSLYTSGHFLLAYDKRKDIAYPLSFNEITNFASNPDRHSDVWYYQRTYTRIDPATNQPASQPTIEWYPVAETQAKGGLQKEITSQPVNPHIVIIDMRVNRDEDEVWGVPDVLPAMPFAWAHSEYLRDGSKLLKALSTIAWKVVSKSKGNATAAAVKMAGAKGGGRDGEHDQRHRPGGDAQIRPGGPRRRGPDRVLRGRSARGEPDCPAVHRWGLPAALSEPKRAWIRPRRTMRCPVRRSGSTSTPACCG
jgi:hypothetical protein